MACFPSTVGRFVPAVSANVLVFLIIYQQQHGFVTDLAGLIAEMTRSRSATRLRFALGIVLCRRDFKKTRNVLDRERSSTFDL